MSLNPSRHQLKLSQIWILSLFVFVAIGCGALKVKLVGQYDEIVDKSVHTIESKTTAHFKKILDNKGLGEGSYEQTKAFYAQMKGEVQALIVRSEVLEDGLKRTPLTQNFKLLGNQYDDLEILHQTPYNETTIQSAQKAFDQSFRAIVKHLIFMKWNQKQP